MLSDKKKSSILKRMQILNISEDDIEEKFITGSGKGGQKLNKTNSCVYLKHIPTGKEVKCQALRSREANRLLARRMLMDLLDPSQKNAKLEKIRKQKKRRIRRSKELPPETD